MNTKQTEALKLALEALEWLTAAEPGNEPPISDAITAIREALAEQPAQCRHRIADARNPVVTSGYLCVDCGALFLAADHTEQPAQQEQGAKDDADIYEFWARNKEAEQPAQQEPGRNHWEDGDVFERIAARKKQPAQQQEPVVWMYVNKSTHEAKFQKHMRDFVDHGLWAEVPLYGEPLANHELQCVCGAVWLGDEMVHLPDKRRPASKPWVGLTQQDIDIAFDDTQEGGGFNEFAHAIEAKLREKNA